MKIIESESNVQHILEPLRHKRKLFHDELSQKRNQPQKDYYNNNKKQIRVNSKNYRKKLKIV